MQKDKNSLKELSFIECGVLYKALEQFKPEDKRLEPVRAALLLKVESIIREYVFFTGSGNEAETK